jgi:hypothetical protein
MGTPELHVGPWTLKSLPRRLDTGWGIYGSKLLDAQWDAKRTDEVRRLLRVAITRARHTVVFVRPGDALPLAPPLPATD